MNEIIKTARKAMAEILADKDLNMTGLNHLIYAQQWLLQKK
jgi:hypothetical protein